MIEGITAPTAATAAALRSLELPAVERENTTKNSKIDPTRRRGIIWSNHGDESRTDQSGGRIPRTMVTKAMNTSANDRSDATAATTVETCRNR